MPRSACPDDSALLEGYLRGDPAALKVVDRWIDSALWHRLGPSREFLDDLRQDVKLRLLENIHRASFLGVSSLKTYVQRIASNVGADFQRRIIGRRRLLEMGRGMVEPVPVESLESLYITLDLARTVLSDLSASDRLLMWLVYGERYTYEEAARRLGKSVGAVKVRAHRCRRHIRDRYPGAH
ncbi:MAG: sigma-70 family RNA polymerase sigma factor [Acidobacteria bacterium]|nr:sigma-70 family RNA polymerase sigma factor [Acidobacteriota bacterium]